jgi:alpha-ribazole phosphatase
MYNEQRRYIGSTDLPLSATGISQTKQLAKCLKEWPQFVVTSDLLRCKQTAELLFPQSNYFTSSLLRECDFGEWEGKTYEQLKENRQYQKWLDTPSNTTIPGGEPYQDFVNRTQAGFAWMLEQIRSQGTDSIVVVTHGGVIRQWLTMFAPMKKNFFEWDVSIGTVFTLQGKLDALRRGERFISLQGEHFTEKIVGSMNT